MSNPASQAGAFYREVAWSRRVWTARDAGGYACPENSQGKRSMPFWSSLERVQRVISKTPAFVGFEPVELSWDEFRERWLAGLKRDGHLVGVNWTGRRASGYDVDPDAVRANVEYFFENLRESPNPPRQEGLQPPIRQVTGDLVMAGTPRSPEVFATLRQRVLNLLKKGALVKATRACRRLGVRPDSLPEIVDAVELALRRRQPQLVLSAFYEAGVFGSHTVEELLRVLARSNMHAAFLKNAFRFGARSGFEREIAEAIQWHRQRGLQDADSWENKFALLEPLPDAPPSTSPESIPIGNPASVPLEVTRLRPVAASPRLEPPAEQTTGDPGDAYIVSRMSRVKVERAMSEHQRTLASLVHRLAEHGYELSNSVLIDLLAHTSGWTGIFEVKSITADNERDQVRHAVGQLFEYRFLHGLAGADLFVVFSCEPFSGWLVDYLRDLGLHVIWIDDGILEGPDLAMLVDHAPDRRAE